MKLFFQRSRRVTYFSNILVSLLCTSSLFMGYYDVSKDNYEQEKTTMVVADDAEVVSQTGNTIEKATLKTTAVVVRKSVNTSNKNYVPAKYDVLTGQAIVDYAKEYLGLHYVSGGYSLKTGTDCSGFTKLIYAEFGINLSRSAVYQSKNGTYIKKADLQKGDLIFYGYGDGEIHHVAIYIGNGQVIHESNKRDGVKLSSVNMMEYITSRRVINDTAIKIVEEQNKKDEIYTNNEYTNSSNDSQINQDSNLVSNEIDDNNSVINSDDNEKSNTSTMDSSIGIYTNSEY